VNQNPSLVGPLQDWELNRYEKRLTGTFGQHLVSYLLDQREAATTTTTGEQRRRTRAATINGRAHRGCELTISDSMTVTDAHLRTQASSLSAI
jgi:hypothetical protein